MGSAVNLKHQKKKAVNLKMNQQNVIQSETQRKKIEEKQSVSETYEATSTAYQLQNGSPRKRGKRNRSRKKIEDIMAENVSNSYVLTYH